MGGFGPRIHVPRGDGTYEYSAFVDETTGYSIVIGSGFIAGKAQLQRYSGDWPLANKIRAYVSEQRCCDDIAFNFISSNASGKPPIWIRTDQTIKLSSSGFAGKSVAPGWQAKRGRAVDAYIEMFGGECPLRINHIFYTRPGGMGDMLDFRWLKHSRFVEAVHEWIDPDWLSPFV